MGQLVSCSRWCWIRKLAAAPIGQVNDRSSYLIVVVFATSLSAHRIFAFECRVQQSSIARFDAWRPSRRIAQLGRTRRTTQVTSATLRLENLFTSLCRPIGIFDLYSANLLNARSNCLTAVVSASGWLVLGVNEVDQSYDDKNGHNKRQENHS